VTPADWALAQNIAEGDRVISVFASPEWGELSDDGKLWIATIVSEVRHRLASEQARVGEGDADALRRAAQALVNQASDTYRKGNGQIGSIEADDGEKCWIVHDDDMVELRAALADLRAAQPTPADPRIPQSGSLQSTGEGAVFNVASFGVAPIVPDVLRIQVTVGSEPLLTITEDGKVEAQSLEAASEAGRVFVQSIRRQLGTDYKPAWEQLYNALAWMQGNKALGRYLGWNFAEIANDLIDRAYPGLRSGRASVSYPNAKTDEDLGLCIGCNEPLRAGQVVTVWDNEVGHYNCKAPYSLARQPELNADEDTPPPVVLIGSPARYAELDAIAATLGAGGDTAELLREIKSKVVYHVENPSAWDTFDQGVSDLLGDIVKSIDSHLGEME